MNTYVVSQIFVIIAILLLGATYFFKDKVKILIFCLLYCVFYGIHYLLLGALTGSMMNLVSFIRNLWFFRNCKKNIKNSKFVLIMLMFISTMFCVITYKDSFSLVSLGASLLSTYSIWQDNVSLYKILAIPVSICFIIYSVHINSIMAIITETVLLLMEIIAITKIYIESRKVRLTPCKKKYKI